MTKKKSKRKEVALDLLGSMRGQYILSQALYVAVKELEKVKEPHKEVSNIADMKLLMSELFPIFKIAHEAEKEYKKQLKSKSRRKK